MAVRLQIQIMSSKYMNRSAFMKNCMFCAVVIISMISANAETIKGSVGFSLCPTIEELAAAYDKSSEKSLLRVADDLFRGRGTVPKNYCSTNKVVVELQTVPGCKKLRTSTVGSDGNFAIEIPDEGPDCRLFCCREIAGTVLSGFASIDWAGVEEGFGQHVQLRADYNSAIGRCLGTDGAPISNAVVEIHYIRTPTEQENSYLNKIQYSRTDTKGYWRVDGIETPSFEQILKRITDTNVVDRYDSRMPPYGIQVSAILESEKGIDAAGGIVVPNVTARDRAAAERIFAAYKRKTGKDWPRPAPMTDFPVSTNNVIYVPDIVLK